MPEISITDLTPLATFLGLALLGALSLLGVKWGEKRNLPTQPAEVVGALVDSASVKMLTAAIEAHTLELTHQRMLYERMGIPLLDALRRTAEELEEMRRAVNDLTNQIARGRGR